MKKTALAVLCVSVMMCAACRSTEEQRVGPRDEDSVFSSETNSEYSSKASSSDSISEIPDEEQRSPAELILDGMTLREKVGQLFIVRPEALCDPSLDLTQPYTSVTALSEEMKRVLGEIPVGGAAFFADNIITPEQTEAFTRELSDSCAIPPFIAVDEEGGKVARLADNPSFGLKKYDSAAAVGASGDTSDALEMGSTIGGYLKQYGFNMDFAPDADVNTNPDNPVIGERAFSSDAETAAAMASAMARGLRGEGVIPVFKHFPGHGDTSEDSHTGAAIVHKTHDEMAACEWLPFENLGELDGVMVGHISIPRITGDTTPASLSEQAVSGILRGELGFEGLVITDALAMGAVKNIYDTETAAVNALLAGCDILLMPDKLLDAFSGVLSAVESGVISEERIDESVLRILNLKIEYGIINSP